MQTISELAIGDTAIISDFDLSTVPLKLIEMGCLPGNVVTLVQTAPFKDPLFLRINGSNIAIRKDTAKRIFIGKKI